MLTVGLDKYSRLSFILTKGLTSLLDLQMAIGSSPPGIIALDISLSELFRTVWGVIEPGFGMSIKELVEIGGGIGYVDIDGMSWLG